MEPNDVISAPHPTPLATHPGGGGLELVDVVPDLRMPDAALHVQRVRQQLQQVVTRARHAVRMRAEFGHAAHHDEALPDR